MHDAVAGRPIQILLVEDNPGDVRLAVEALRYTTVRNQLHIVQDGVEAMSFLRREGQYVGIPRPDLVLLDANPLEAISNTQKISAVVLNGRLLDRKALDRLLAHVESAAHSN